MSESSHLRQRPLRADAEKSVVRILAAAERMFAIDPSVSLEAIAQAAGVARTTIHRRFSSRDDLKDSLVDVVNAKLRDAFAEANVGTAPPLLALYELTIATLNLKVDWRASWQLVDMGGRGIDPDNIDKLDALLRRSRDGGLLHSDVPIPWSRSVYMALIHEVAIARPDDEPVAEWAHLLMRTLLGGIGNHQHDFESLLAAVPNTR